MIRNYEVTGIKPFTFKWVSDYRPLRSVDTVRLLKGGKIHIMELRCESQFYAKSRLLRKEPLTLGDTLQAVIKL